jgi:glutathione S-transferase
VTITLYYHPFTRAGAVVTMLEEVGVSYDLHFMDFTKGAHKAPEFLALNPMGKLPTLTDGPVLVTEAAAVGLYLADRYASGRLAPALDDPDRGSFLRWTFYPSAVIEPACAAKGAGFEYRPASVGWGTYDSMLATVEHAIGDGPFLLGERFTMADVTMGTTLNFMLRFKMIDPKPAFVDYVARLSARPAWQRAAAINAREIAAHGLGG